MSEYKEVLFKWAHEKLERYWGTHGFEIESVDSVDFYYDEGYKYSTYTYEDPSFEVSIAFHLVGHVNQRLMFLRNEECQNMGQLLTELFQIAEREES